MADLKAELLKTEVPVGASSGSLQTSTDGIVTKVNDISKTLLKQIEYYFSNNNLWRDQFLLTEIAKDPEGWVPINVVAEFPRIKALSSDLLQICSALRQSKKLELSRDLFKVRRIHVVPPYNPKKDAKRTIYVDKLPPGSTLKSVRKLFSKFGRVTYVTKVNPLGESITPQTDVREAPPQEVSNTAEITTALVEFAKKEAAKKAITMIQAHNLKKGIIFPATPTNQLTITNPLSTTSPSSITLLPSPSAGGSGTSSILSPSITSLPSPTTNGETTTHSSTLVTPPSTTSTSSLSPSQPVVAYDLSFEIKALDFKLKKDSPVSSPTPQTGGTVSSPSFIKITPAMTSGGMTTSITTIPPTSPSVDSHLSPAQKETQSAPSSVSSSPATSPPSSTGTGGGHGHRMSSLSRHASPFVPSSPAASTSVGSSPSLTPTSRPPSSHDPLFTPLGGTPVSSPGCSPPSPASTPSSGSGSTSQSPSTPPNGQNSSPPKEIDINLYTGFHILTKMSYLKKLSQLTPMDGSISAVLSAETKKIISSGGKQSPFRFMGAQKPPRSPFNPWRDGEDDGGRPKGHNRSNSGPSYPVTFAPPALGVQSPIGKGTPDGRAPPLGGRSTPDRGGRITPTHTDHRGAGTPDRSHGGYGVGSTGGRQTPDRVGHGGRSTPDRAGRSTPDRDRGRSTPDRDRIGGRSTPDRSMDHSRDRSGTGTPDRRTFGGGGGGTPQHQQQQQRPGSGSGNRDRSNSSGQSAFSPRAGTGLAPPRSGTPGQSPARESETGRHRSGSADQPPEYYKAKYDEEKLRNELLQKQLQQLMEQQKGGPGEKGGPGGGGSSGSGSGGGGGSPRHSPKSSPHKNRRRARSTDMNDKTERAGYQHTIAEEPSRPRLKLLSSRISSAGVSIAQRFAQGPDESGGFLGGRGAGRGRGAPPSSAPPS